MTTTYDPTAAARLVTAAREDDARMPDAPWRTEHPTMGGRRYFPSVFTHEPATAYDRLVINGDATGHPCSMERCDAMADGIARTRNNLCAMADQLEAAIAEVDALKVALIEAADRVDRSAVVQRTCDRIEDDPDWQMVQRWLALVTR